MAISKASNSSIKTGLVKSKSLKADPVLPFRDGLIMWYDASNRSSLSLSGASVTQWNDLSGNGRHASGGSSPQYVENAQNGRAAVDFGTDAQYRLIIANPVTFASKNCHFFAVAKTRKEANTDNSAIIGMYSASGGNGALCWSFPGNGGTGGQQQFLNNSLAWGSPGNKNDYVSTTFYNVNAALDVGTTTYRASRADDGAGGSQTGTISRATDALGHQEGLGSGGNVTIAELICFGYKLSDANRDKVENYLFEKWGV
jgi:hypothetical protein